MKLNQRSTLLRQARGGRHGSVVTSREWLQYLTTDFTDATDKGMIHHRLTEDIIGAAMTVLNKLKPGLDEKLYERALVLELIKRGHVIEQQRAYSVYYDGVEIGKLVPDLIVDRTVIADPKVATDFNESHVAQMIGYLNITELRVALLLNFKHSDLRWKRIVR